MKFNPVFTILQNKYQPQIWSLNSFVFWYENSSRVLKYAYVSVKEYLKCVFDFEKD